MVKGRSPSVIVTKIKKKETSLEDFIHKIACELFTFIIQHPLYSHLAGRSAYFAILKRPSFEGRSGCAYQKMNGPFIPLDLLCGCMEQKRQRDGTKGWKANWLNCRVAQTPFYQLVFFSSSSLNQRRHDPRTLCFNYPIASVKRAPSPQ